MFRYLVLLLSLISFACNPSTDTGSASSYQLGEAQLVNSGNEEAKPHFDKGLLLMHSFEYEDARAAFVAAQQADADFALAYWGEAMTHNQPIWHRQQYEKGKAALEKLAATPAERLAKAPAEQEKDLLQAAEVLFGEGEKVARDSAYALAMEKLFKKYPDNQEIAAFYALSLLGAVPAGRDVETYERSARIAQSILRENPSHPGALHYLIHSYDDPQHAHMALPAANSYAKVAPDAAHALHMPSHIYVAMGMWDEVITSNIASYQASVQRMKAKELDNDARSYHAFHWLMYGYLQKGAFEEAQSILKEMVQYTEELPSKGARSYLIRMKGNALVDMQAWEDTSVTNIKLDISDLNISHQAIHHFLEGFMAYRNNDAQQLSTIIDTLARKIQQAEMSATNEGLPLCGNNSSYSKVNYIEVGQAQVMALELKALFAQLRNDDEQAEKLMKEAVELQDGLSYSYGPVEIVYPAYEFYADWLNSNSRKAEAIAMYEKSMERGPKRRGPLQAIAELEGAQKLN
jgi:tetratricopeptide (TPR) repeat protein